MADFFSDFLDALVTNDPGARQALRETRALDDAQQLHEHQLDALHAQVAALQRTIATLTEVLVRSGVVSEADRTNIVRAARGLPAVDDTRSRNDVESSPVAQSPYRGSGPLRRCAACGKVLAEDEPDLHLAAG